MPCGRGESRAGSPGCATVAAGPSRWRSSWSKKRRASAAMATTAASDATTYRGPYDLTEDQELFKRSIHEFVEREIVPIAHDFDEREVFPRETVQKMGALGLLGMLVPEEFGGASTSTLD